MLLRGKPSARLRAALLAMALFAPLTPIGAFGAESPPAEVWVDGLFVPSPDAAPDGSPANPFTTLQAGAAAVADDGNVYVRPAVYSGHPVSIVLARGQHLQGVSRETGEPVHGSDWGGLVRGTVEIAADQVTVDGLAFAIPDPEPSSWNAVLLNGGRGVVVSDNLMVGPESGAIATRGISTSQQAQAGVMDVLIKGNRIADVQFGVVVNQGAEAHVTENEIVGTKDNGITLDSGDPAKVESNHIHHNLGAGVAVRRFPEGTVLRRNSFSGNATAVWALTGVAVHAYQNWWGHASGPVTERSAPSVEGPDVQPGEEPDPDAAGDDIEGNQQEAEEHASRQKVSGDVDVDPWCSSDGCPQAPVSVHGIVSGTGGPVAGAEVKANWGDPIQETSAQTDAGGAYRLAFDRPWGQVDGTAVAITARKDDWSDARTLTLDGTPATAQDFTLAEDGEQASAAQSSISAEPLTVPADGTTPATISVTVRTADGQLRTSPDGDVVEVATTFGELDEPQWVGEGVWQAHLTSTQPGDAEVFAFVNGQPVNSSVEIEFVVGSPSPEHSTITSSNASLTADGTSASTMTVTVRDGGGNLRPTTTTERHDIVRLSVNTKADGTPNGTLGPVIDNGDGTYTAEYRASTTTGTAVISAHVRESLVHEEVTLGNASIALTPGPASAARSTMSSDDSEIPADSATPLTVTVQVKDGHGNDRTRGADDPADMVTFTSEFVTTEGGSPERTTTVHPDVAADEHGVATIQLTSAQKGRMTVTAKLDEQGVPGAVAATFGDVPPAPDPSKSTIVTDASQRAANGTHAAKITLQVTGTDDQNYAGSVQVSLTASGAGKLSSSASTPGASGTISGPTSSTGEFEAYLTSGVAGPVDVSGAIGNATITDASGQPVTVTVTFDAVSSPGHSTLSTSADDEDATNSDPVAITFQAKDASGADRPLAGEVVVLSTTVGTLAAPSGATNASGQYTTTLQSGTAGTAVVTATLNGQPVTSSVQVKFHALAHASHTSIMSDRDVVGADGIRTATITLQLRDATGAGRTRQGRDSVTPVTSTGVHATPATYVGNGQWQFQVSSRIVRQDTPVSAEVNDFAIEEILFIDFEPATSAMRSTLTRNPASGNLRANGTDSVTIEVQANNAAGSARTGDGDDVQLTVTGLPQASLSPVTYAGGATGKYRATLTSTGAGTAIVTGRVNGEPIQGSSTNPTSIPVTFTAVASATHSTVELATPSEAGDRLANGTDGTGVVAQLRDAAGAALSAAGDHVELTTSLGYFDVAGQPATIRGPVGSDGRLAATVKSATVGVATIEAFLLTDQDGDGVRETRTAFGTTATVTFQPLAAPETTTLTASPEELVGNNVAESVITIQAKDASGASGANRTTGREVFTLTANPSVGTTLSSVTDMGDGTYTARLKSSVSGPVQVTATIRGLAVIDNATINFVGKGAGVTSIAAVLNDFVAANDSNLARVSVQVRRADSSLQTVPGDTITLTTAPGVTASSPVYQGGGAYVFTVKSSVPTQTLVGIKVNGEDMPPDKWPSITFEPATAPDKTTITALTSPILGDGNESSVIEVQTKNAAGRDRRGVDDAVVLSVGAGHAFANGQQTVTATPAGAGKYTAVLTSTTPGTATVTGTVDGTAITASASVVVHGATSPPDSVLSTTDADGKIVVSTTDANGEIVPSNMVLVLTPRTAAGQHRQTAGDTVVLTTDRGSFEGAPAATPHQFQAVWDASSKTYQATLVAGTAAGPARITGTVNSAVIGSPVGGLVVQFVPGAASTATSLVEADPEKITADGSSISTITVTLKDANGNALTQSHTQPVTVSSTRGSVISVTNNNDGTYTALLRAASSAAVATVRAKIGPNPTDFVTDTATVTMEATSSASSSGISATPTSAPADGQGTVAITVQARSGPGVNRTIGGDKVELTATRGVLSAVTDQGTGTYTATLTAPVQSGSVTLGGEINDAALPTTNVSFFAVTKAAGSDISASPTSISADGTSTSTITVTAKDHAGVARTAGGETVVLSTTAGTLSAVTDNANGTYTATLTAPTQAGSATVSGTIGGGAITDTATVTFEAFAPGAPDEVSASPGDEASEVSWTAPASTGGVPLSHYVVTATPDEGAPVSGSADAPASQLTLAGLDNGVTYDVTVKAVNEAEEVSTATPAAAPVTPFGSPQAVVPTIDRSSGAITLAWDPVGGNGRPITAYEVTAVPTAGGDAVTQEAELAPDADDGKIRHVFNALTQGVEYDFTVVARNSGDKASVPSDKLTRRFATHPGVPSGLTATAGNGRVTLSWTAPDTGGEPISTYLVMAKPASGPAIERQTGSAGITYDVSGLTNGTAYTFTVAATNELGSSAESASVTATPTAPSGGGGTPPPPVSPSPSPSPTVSPSPSPSPTAAPGPLPGPGPVRINGEDRASTAAAVSASHFDPGVSVVYVATAANFADALAGGPAAAHGGGPVLLVERDRVPESTAFELQRLEPDRVVVLGGTGAVSDLVLEQLDETGPVERVSGTDRFSTAAAVSRTTFPERVSVAYVATGNGFADALSGGAAAARDRGPILLAGNGELPEATAEELRRLAPRQIVVLGGSGAVSPEVAAGLAEYTDGSVERLSGSDRYATSAAIAARMFPVAVDTVFVATGENFPDALAGVPAAAREKAPLLLVRHEAVPEAVAAQLERLRPRRIVILGGSGAVSAETEDALSAYTVE